MAHLSISFIIVSCFCFISLVEEEACRPSSAGQAGEVSSLVVEAEAVSWQPEGEVEAAFWQPEAEGEAASWQPEAEVAASSWLLGVVGVAVSWWQQQQLRQWQPQLQCQQQQAQAHSWA